MNLKTTIYTIKPYLLILIVILTGCRKEDQETVVHIRCVTPHNNQPVKGCKVIITEGKMKSGGLIGLNVSFDAIQQFSGITDENGVATIRFHYKKKNKFQYILSYDYSGITPPNGMTDADIKLPYGWSTYLDKKQFEFNYEFRMFGKCNIHQKFENVNCLNSDDSVYITSYNISEYFWDPFPYSDYYYKRYGCGVVSDYTTDNFNLNSGLMVYKLRIFRNGIESIKWDTIPLYPGITNEAIIEY